MIYSSLILSALCAYLVRSQDTEATATATESQSAPTMTVAFSSILENVLNGEGNASSILSDYSDQISSALESLSTAESESTFEKASTSVYESTPAYPTGVYEPSVPSESYYKDIPEIICSISCTVDETTTTQGSAQTETVYRRSLQNDSAPVSNDVSEGDVDVSEVDDGISEGDVDLSSSPVNGNGRMGQPILPGGPNVVGESDEDCLGRVRPIAPQTPWGWPSRFHSQRSRPYQCYYHAATAPECKNIHDQAVATYCVKSPRPNLCKVRACQVLDQCKRIISNGRGYCWNPKWFIS